MRNKLKHIRRVVYKLKRSYGLPIDYYQTVSHQTDAEVGTKVTVLLKTRIRKVIVLPAREFRSFVYDLAYISANKDFTAGGFFDPGDRRVIIDPVDLPAGVEPKIDDYYIYKNEKYEVKEVSCWNDYAHLLLARKLKGALLVRIESALSVINLQQTATNYVQDKLDRSVESVLTLTQEVKEVP